MESKTPQPQTASIPIPKARRGGLKGYLNEVSRELRKVEWPPTHETNRLTGVVLAVCGMLGLIMMVFSYAIMTIFNILQGKL